MVGADLKGGAEGIGVGTAGGPVVADRLHHQLSNGLEGPREEVVEHAEVALDVGIVGGDAEGEGLAVAAGGEDEARSVLDQVSAGHAPGYLAAQILELQAADGGGVRGTDPIHGVLGQLPLQQAESPVGDELKTGDAVEEASGQDLAGQLHEPQ